MDKKILITGCNGQLGRGLQEAAIRYPALQLLCTDIHNLDLTSNDEVMAYALEHHPAFIINCAAYTAVDKAEDEEDKAFAINAAAVENLAKAVGACRARLIHISTDYVFDGTKTTPYTEEDAPNPQSAYGRSKLAGEQAALSHPQTMVIRTAWLYACEGNNFVNTMLRLGAERPTLNVVNDQHGSPTYAADLAETLLAIIDKVICGEKKFVPGVYHYTNEGVCTWFDFAQRIMQLGRRHCAIQPVSTAGYPTKAVRPKYSILSKEKIKTTYELAIPSWEDALARCFQKKCIT
ncbi:MAG: dTDP-4-dehydrorhamnose reductase [Prevotellaceae bacterium]|jgi:dTDP-4-dehydrorhamnose reductase|nr:dTDP-4-dehydrorhamnose reductase [Prevotellaceae bacterium]